MASDKPKLDDLQYWTTAEIILVVKRGMEILKARAEKERARDKSLEALIRGGKK